MFVAEAAFSLHLIRAHRLKLLLRLRCRITGGLEVAAIVATLATVVWKLMLPGFLLTQTKKVRMWAMCQCNTHHA